jgi:hypothetical protein
MQAYDRCTYYECGKPCRNPNNISLPTCHKHTPKPLYYNTLKGRLNFIKNKCRKEGKSICVDPEGDLHYIRGDRLQVKHIKMPNNEKFLLNSEGVIEVLAQRLLHHIPLVAYPSMRSSNILSVDECTQSCGQQSASYSAPPIGSYVNPTSVEI